MQDTTVPSNRRTRNASSEHYQHHLSALSWSALPTYNGGVNAQGSDRVLQAYICSDVGASSGGSVLQSLSRRGGK